ncbi:YihY/virulence factor BrkB family protein [Mobilitalea sibirica]|uniref:YihY/virulence factor BrkB family protein n=1 Tax=Mobilitalea sibirica TaxID=1462919 RepID=A0A8J7KWE7_9FIRM|nr:YihY/virulence factor BrkB family protein [Mobilitalea sibirica]MBH1940317.1 YihY/virulence factor BrkB family protein [Mobilitalea sibirica]
MIKSTLKLIGLLGRKIRDDHVAAFSAQAAFFIIISFFPFIMLLLSIVRYFPFEESTMLKVFTQVFPTAINSLIVSVISEIYDTTSSGTLISVTAITALWSAGKGFLAILKGLNSVYEIKETRKYILLRISSAVYTLVFAVMLIASMVLFVFGNRLYLWIEQKFPVLRDLALLIISLRTIVGLVTLLIFFLIIYIAIPNRKTKFMNELPGAMVCAAGWMGFSYAYSFYIDNFANYASMYGSLTAIVLFMLWMYFCMYILFIGAEINLLFENKALMQKIKQLYKKPSEASIIRRD